MSLEFVAVAAGVVATLIPAALKLIEGAITSAAARETPPADESILDRRFREVAIQIKRQTNLIHLNWWASTVLRFGQYVIGGILATAFVRDTLTPNTVGLLGVLVLMASLIHQHFRPDVTLQECRGRLYRLRRVARRAEDEWARTQKHLSNAKTEEEIATMLSRGLNEVDRLELTGGDPGAADTPLNESL